MRLFFFSPKFLLFYLLMYWNQWPRRQVLGLWHIYLSCRWRCQHPISQGWLLSLSPFQKHHPDDAPGKAAGFGPCAQGEFQLQAWAQLSPGPHSYLGRIIGGFIKIYKTKPVINLSSASRRCTPEMQLFHEDPVGYILSSQRVGKEVRIAFKPASTP